MLEIIFARARGQIGKVAAGLVVRDDRAKGVRMRLAAARMRGGVALDVFGAARRADKARPVLPRVVIFAPRPVRKMLTSLVNLFEVYPGHALCSVFRATGQARRPPADPRRSSPKGGRRRRPALSRHKARHRAPGRAAGRSRPGRGIGLAVAPEMQPLRSPARTGRAPQHVIPARLSSLQGKKRAECFT